MLQPLRGKKRMRPRGSVHNTTLVGFTARHPYKLCWCALGLSFVCASTTLRDCTTTTFYATAAGVPGVCTQSTMKGGRRWRLHGGSCRVVWCIAASRFSCTWQQWRFLAPENINITDCGVLWLCSQQLYMIRCPRSAVMNRSVGYCHGLHTIAKWGRLTHNHQCVETSSDIGRFWHGCACLFAWQGFRSGLKCWVCCPVQCQGLHAVSVSARVLGVCFAAARCLQWPNTALCCSPRGLRSLQVQEHLHLPACYAVLQQHTCDMVCLCCLPLHACCLLRLRAFVLSSHG